MSMRAIKMYSSYGMTVGEAALDDFVDAMTDLAASRSGRSPGRPLGPPLPPSGPPSRRSENVRDLVRARLLLLRAFHRLEPPRVGASFYSRLDRAGQLVSRVMTNVRSRLSHMRGAPTSRIRNVSRTVNVLNTVRLRILRARMQVSPVEALRETLRRAIQTIGNVLARFGSYL